MERYPGPGQYCPGCGEALSDFIIPAEPARTSKRGGRWIVVAAVLIAVGLLVAAAAGGTRLIPALGVAVCASTMTDRVAGVIVAGYKEQHREWPNYFTLTKQGNVACDVRFVADDNGPATAIIARDGVVAIVNPQNRLTRLGANQLRAILAGRITNWASVGEPGGQISVALPGDDSDEARIIAAKVMGTQSVGTHVNRTLTAEQIVRWVSSPSGAHSIGIVPFSGALPAKVLALGTAPAPSTISIADGRYPLALRIMVESDYRAPSPPANALMAFAHSTDAGGLIARTALVIKNGS